MTDADIVVVAVASARSHGCNCNPEVRLREHDGITFATICHDTWCALLRRTTRSTT